MYTNNSIDTYAVSELTIYTNNTGRLYTGIITATIENMKRKIKRGTYDEQKALKAWENVATAAAKEYAKEFAFRDAWHKIFPVSVRRAAAVDLMEYYDEFINE